MRASLSIKINIAIIISLAFIFRLLFADTCLFNSPENARAEHHACSHLQKTHKKRKRSPEVAIRSNFEKYATVDVYEENPDNKENLIKADSPVLLSFRYSSVFKKANSQLAGHAFDPAGHNLHPKKYLVFSILRI